MADRGETRQKGRRSALQIQKGVRHLCLVMKPQDPPVFRQECPLSTPQSRLTADCEVSCKNFWGPEFSNVSDKKSGISNKTFIKIKETGHVFDKCRQKLHENKNAVHHQKFQSQKGIKKNPGSQGDLTKGRCHTHTTQRTCSTVCQLTFFAVPLACRQSAGTLVDV